MFPTSTGLFMILPPSNNVILLEPPLFLKEINGLIVVQNSFPFSLADWLHLDLI